MRATAGRSAFVGAGGGRDGAPGGRPHGADGAEPHQDSTAYRFLDPRTVGRLGQALPRSMQWPLAGLGALLVFLAFGAILGWWRARRLEGQRERLLEEVGLLQAALLPAVPERLGDLLASVAYRPWEGPGAGGDFYDAFALGSGRVGLVIGDVSGHGREVLSRTASLRYTLRAYLEAGLEPRAALAVGGRVLDADFDAAFATVALAVYDEEAKTLTYAAAGHPPPILLGPPEHEPVTAGSSTPIGAGLPTGLRQTTVAMTAGAVACFFTDGLVEARTRDGMLGRERLAAMLEDLGPQAGAPALLSRVTARAQEISDDMAVCIFRAEGRQALAVAQPAPRIEELALEGDELDTSAAQRFLWACGIPPQETPPAVSAARALAAASGAVLLRVRLGDRRAEVEVLAPEDEEAAGLSAWARTIEVDR